MNFSRLVVQTQLFHVFTALDQVDFVFEQPEIATDFCRLVRADYYLLVSDKHHCARKGFLYANKVSSA